MMNLGAGIWLAVTVYWCLRYGMEQGILRSMAHFMIFWIPWCLVMAWFR